MMDDSGMKKLFHSLFLFFYIYQGEWGRGKRGGFRKGKGEKG